MPRYIAFLRAINVGGHTVKMDRLRRFFEALGCANVETFIASGNVIFESPARNIPALETKIARHLHQALGYAVATFIRTESELTQIAHAQPFHASTLKATGNYLYVAFLAATPNSTAQTQLMSFRNTIDDFHIEAREVYWLCRKTLGESQFSGALLEKTLRMPATLRNFTTVQKLAAKYPVL